MHYIRWKESAMDTHRYEVALGYSLDPNTINPYPETHISRATVRGERLPGVYTHGLDLCTIHAIRHHDTFARSEAVAKFCEASEDKRYARARNARLIMSNEIPEMATDEVKPYCFWHPDIANEDTYRQLIKRYPDPKLAYSVGRACAVAGYDQLYHELDILPDVSIAEEARESFTLSNTVRSKVGSKAIFDHIMRQPICYAVMDDYTRTINHHNPRSPAFINGDTAVRSTLDVTVSLKDYYTFGDPLFDITEDGHISETGTHRHFLESQGTLPSKHVELLYVPLPPHLPISTTFKDPLILMAAYEGNLDRYLRLRRPRMVEHERSAVLRGIYHNTTFAKWWSLQDDDRMDWDIKAATIARFIMVNDLSHITRASPEPLHVPGMIWWPLIPQEETLEELARLRPDMELQVAMACIAGNYKRLWDKLAPEPCRQLMDHASQGDSSVRNHFVEYLERRAKELYPDGIEYLDAHNRTRADDQCLDAAKLDKEPTTLFLWSDITLHLHYWGCPGSDSIYGGHEEQANLTGWELRISSPEEMVERARQKGGLVTLNDEVWRSYRETPALSTNKIAKDVQSSPSKEEEGRDS
jgi:hypothetical protein